MAEGVAYPHRYSAGNVKGGRDISGRKVGTCRSKVVTPGEVSLASKKMGHKENGGL